MTKLLKEMIKAQAQNLEKQEGFEIAHPDSLTDINHKYTDEEIEEIYGFIKD